MVNKPIPVAQWTTEWPSLSRALTSVWLASSRLTRLMFPWMTARWSGVNPSSSADSSSSGAAIATLAAATRSAIVCGLQIEIRAITRINNVNNIAREHRLFISKAIPYLSVQCNNAVLSCCCDHVSVSAGAVCATRSKEWRLHYWNTHLHDWNCANLTNR